jgi:IS1 family transposase
LTSYGASSEKKDKHTGQPYPDPARGDVWIWRCIDPISRFRVANHLSKTRDIADAEMFLRKVADKIDYQQLLFTTDKLKAYAKALLEVFGKEEPEAQDHVGRPRTHQRKVMPDNILYGQVDKEREKGHLVCVERRSVFGSIEQIQALLAKDGQSKVINTSFVERDNLTVRQHNSRTVRKTLSYSKDWQMHQDAIDFEDAVHNFARAHSSLRVKLPEPEGPRKYQKRTPAMAIGLTDHIWSIRELVTYKVPSRLLRAPPEYSTATNIYGRL